MLETPFAPPLASGAFFFYFPNFLLHILFSFPHTKKEKRRRNNMNKFTTGMLVGGAAAIMGVGYLMQDKKTYRKMMKKGKTLISRKSLVKHCTEKGPSIRWPFFRFLERGV